MIYSNSHFSDANASYGNLPNRPHSLQQPDIQNGSFIEQHNQQQFKTGN